MKFLIQRNPLLEALNQAQSVVEKKSTVPILSNVLLEAHSSGLTLSATDLEVGMKWSLQAQVLNEGKLTISAKALLDIVKELPQQTIEISRKDNEWVEILCGKSKFKVVSLSANEFPALPKFEEKQYHKVHIPALKTMMDKTSFAVSTDTTRYLMNGVFFEPLTDQAGKFRMTATDGHRLAMSDQVIFEPDFELQRGIIIPKKGLSELRKFLEREDQELSLAFDRGYLFASLKGAYLFIRLIEGEYPDYRQVIPKQADKSVQLSREDFSSALKRVSLLANEKSKGVRFQIQPTSLVISSSNPDLGEAREELDISFEGEGIHAGFNSKYLLDYLNVVDESVLEFSLKDGLSPGILRAKQDQANTYVIMPMRI